MYSVTSLAPQPLAVLVIIATASFSSSGREEMWVPEAYIRRVFGFIQHNAFTKRNLEFIGGSAYAH